MLNLVIAMLVATVPTTIMFAAEPTAPAQPVWRNLGPGGGGWIQSICTSQPDVMYATLWTEPGRTTWQGGGGTPLEPDNGLYKPSGNQMTYFFEMFFSIDWWRLEPAHELILNQPSAPTAVDDPAWLTRMVMAKTPNGDLGVAYLPDNPLIQVDMTAFPTAMQAKWFDPVIGKYAPVSAAIPTDRPHTFVRSTGWEDAVLLLMRPTDTARE
jgi:hypothetical protein